MSFSYIIFVKKYTQLYRSQQLNFIFGIDHINTISHDVVLYGFHHSWHLVRLVTIVQYRFSDVEHLCTIDHVIVLSGFRHRAHQVQ